MQIFTFSSRLCTFFVMVLSSFFSEEDRQTRNDFTIWNHLIVERMQIFLPLEISIKFFEFNIVLRRIIYPLFSNICHNTMMAMMDVSMHKTNRNKSNTSGTKAHAHPTNNCQLLEENRNETAFWFISWSLTCCWFYRLKRLRAASLVTLNNNKVDYRWY